jgi:hypothetical protein
LIDASSAEALESLDGKIGALHRDEATDEQKALTLGFMGFRLIVDGPKGIGYAKNRSGNGLGDGATDGNVHPEVGRVSLQPCADSRILSTRQEVVVDDHEGRPGQ